MKPVLSKKEATLVDCLSIDGNHISQDRLMDNAGMLSAQFFVENIKNPFNKKVLVIAGKGNNGGDAIIMHHYLLHYGIDSSLLIIDSRNKKLIKKYQILKKYRIEKINEKSIRHYDWVVDGIFGIGLSRKITGKYKKIIQTLDGQDIISLDIPSGLECDTGNPISSNIFIKPKYVLSMGFYKYGNLINRSKGVFKRTKILDIGFPQISKLINNIRVHAIEKADVKSIIRDDDFLRHKYSGACSMILGSREYSGAGALSVLGALKSGASYCRVAMPGKIASLYSNILESVDLPVGNREYFTSSDYKVITESDLLSKNVPILIGPGLGAKKGTTRLTSKLLDHLRDRENICVLDASGFEPLYESKEIKDLPKNCILTPHSGEFEKIFPDIESENPLRSYKKIIKRLDKRVLVLKGPSTFIFTTTGRVYILNNGNSLLATAGSGDVLSGVILGLLAKGYNSDDASILGVYVHGLCSHDYIKKTSSHSMCAKDIIKILPQCFNEVYK